MARKQAAKAPKAEETSIKRKPGRQPMTDEEKETAAKVRAEEKERAENLKPEIVVQYQGGEIDMAALVESAKADFHKEKKRTLITALKLYVKPEEHMAYYVVNGSHEGKVTYQQKIPQHCNSTDVFYSIFKVAAQKFTKY